MGTVALVLGLVGIVFPLASLGAIICGTIGLTGRRASKGLAGVGLALGLIVPAAYAAILLPVFVAARGKAQQASCQSNLKQLELALIMYVSDYDEKFPAAEEWPGATYPYLKNAQIHICPSDSRPSKQTHTYAGAPGGAMPTSYTINTALGGSYLGGMPNPAYTVSLYEGTTISGDLTSPAVRHNQGLNVGFADGHVKWFRATAFPPTGSGPSYSPSFP
jgi:prepilin-type processing-associated H-X9-DG protein